MKYFVTAVSILVLLFIFGEAGYFYIEYFQEHLVWTKNSMKGKSVIFNNNSPQFYVGIKNVRLDHFDNTLQGAGKTREVTDFRDSSDYYGLFTKTISMSLLLKEKTDTAIYHIYIRGSFNGLCSPQGARERVMLMLRQIEFDKIPR